MILIPTDGLNFYYWGRTFFLRNTLMYKVQVPFLLHLLFGASTYNPPRSLNLNLANLFTWVSLGSRNIRGLFGLVFTFKVKAMESLSHSFFLNMLAHLFQGFHIPWEVVLSKVNFKVKQILVHLAVCPMCFL